MRERFQMGLHTRRAEWSSSVPLRMLVSAALNSSKWSRRAECHNPSTWMVRRGGTGSILIAPSTI